MGASLLSFCPRLLMNDHHWKGGKWFKDKEQNSSVTNTEANEPSRFAGGDAGITFRPYIACRLKDAISDFQTNKSGSSFIVWVFLDHPVGRN